MGSTPIWFRCPVARRNPEWTGSFDTDRLGRPVRSYRVPTKGHEIARTGRTKENPSHRRTSRTLGDKHEYVCSCGHRGWTTHVDILNYPIKVTA